MSSRSPLNKADLLLLFWSVVLGFAAASAFSAFRAANGDDTVVRDFVENLAWPGVLIALAIATMVWFGWKANLD